MTALTERPAEAFDHCRSCHAEIFWGLTAKGKRMPLDPIGSHPNPNLDFWHDEGIVKVRPHAHEDVPLTGLVGMTTSHFATCPNADRHRRRH